MPGSIKILSMFCNHLFYRDVCSARTFFQSNVKPYSRISSRCWTEYSRFRRLFDVINIIDFIFGMIAWILYPYQDCPTPPHTTTPRPAPKCPYRQGVPPSDRRTKLLYSVSSLKSHPSTTHQDILLVLNRSSQYHCKPKTLNTLEEMLTFA